MSKQLLLVHIKYNFQKGRSKNSVNILSYLHTKITVYCTTTKIYVRHKNCIQTLYNNIFYDFILYVNQLK